MKKQDFDELMETFDAPNLDNQPIIKSMNNQLNNVKTNILSTQAQIDQQTSEIEKKTLQLEEKQKQVFGQSQELDDKTRLLETRNKMLQLSIERNAYKKKVIYSLLAVIIAFLVGMLFFYSFASKMQN